MNKPILSTIILLTLLMSPLATSAATFSLIPSNVSVTAGQTFTVNVSLNPQGVKNYTAKVELNYPANLLEVQSFTFASNWMPLSQPGYDLVNNASGTMIKSAGYPAGVSSQTTFGTVSFRAKATGSGSISVSAQSAVYDGNSSDVLTGDILPVSVTVSQSTQIPTVGTEDADEEILVAEETEETVDESVPEGSLLANVGNAITLGTGNAIVGFLFLVILALAVYGGFSVAQRIGKR